MASVLDPEFYLKTLKDINKSLDKLKCFVEECCKKIPENIGSGIGIYRRLHNNKWEFKSLVAGANTTISETFDEITISSTGGGGSFNCNDLNSCSTDSLPEGLSNLYYTNGRVLSYVSTLPISTFSNDIPYLSIVSVDGITITGDGTHSNPLIAVFPPDYISAVSNTSSINLSVIAGSLEASFASYNISQFTNNSNYITLTSLSGGLGISYDNTTGVITNNSISGGGGGGVEYYFNGSVASDIVGDYQMSSDPNTGAASNFTKTGDGLIVTFATDPTYPNATSIPGGVWVFHSYLSMSANGGSPEINVVVKIFDGAIYTTLATGNPYLVSNGTNTDLYTFGVPIPQTTIAATDRIVIEFYLSNSLGKTITFYTQDARLNSVSTTLPTGISILNGLTASTQFFANDTNVTMSSSGATHTLGWTGTLADSRITSASTWNDKVTSISAGTGISIGGTTTIPIVTNSAPDQTVVLTAGTGISTSGTYPNFTITNTAPATISGSGTTNEIAYFSGSSTLSSLTTATYPSLTELSYVKGVTSSIQTQIDNISGGYDTQFAMYQDIGSACVAGTYGATFDRMSASVAGGALSSGQAIFMLIRFTKADTILGLKWFQGTQGNYTANNYNGVFLATLSAGILTVVASSTTDGNIWKGTSNSLQSKAFSAGYAVSANTTYVVGAVYSSSAQVTLPTIYGVASTATTAQGAADFANSVKLYAFKSAVTAVPTTQAYSGLTGSNILPVFFAYK